MLQSLLDDFDDCDNFNDLAKQQKKIRKGCCGMHYRGKSYNLWCHGCLRQSLDTNKRYLYFYRFVFWKESVIRCWRKASILPLNLVEQLNILDPVVASRPPCCRVCAQNTNELPDIPIPNPNTAVAPPAAIQVASPAAYPSAIPPAAASAAAPADIQQWRSNSWGRLSQRPRGKLLQCQFW